MTRFALAGVALALGCVLLAGDVAAGGTPPAPVEFQSPSGNIRCTLGPTAGRAGARCVALTPRLAAQVVAGQRARALRFAAVGPLPPSDPLRDGSSIRGFGFRCRSELSGVTCIDGRTGNGFTIAREGVSLLPAPTSGDTGGSSRRCNPNYAGVCLPPHRDVDCQDIPATDFRVVGTDVYRLDRDGDRIACESAGG